MFLKCLRVHRFQIVLSPQRSIHSITMVVNFRCQLDWIDEELEWVCFQERGACESEWTRWGKTCPQCGRAPSKQLRNQLKWIQKANWSFSLTPSLTLELNRLFGHENPRILESQLPSTAPTPVGSQTFGLRLSITPSASLVLRPSDLDWASLPTSQHLQLADSLSWTSQLP
jgi:hypothetical protein